MMKKKDVLNEVIKGIVCALIVIVVTCSLINNFNNTYISQNTYTVNAVSYEYGSIAIDKQGKKYSIIDPPEYPDETKVTLVLYDMLTKDKDDDIIVFIDEEK